MFDFNGFQQVIDLGRKLAETINQLFAHIEQTGTVFDFANAFIEPQAHTQIFNIGFGNHNRDTGGYLRSPFGGGLFVLRQFSGFKTGNFLFQHVLI